MSIMDDYTGTHCPICGAWCERRGHICGPVFQPAATISGICFRCGVSWVGTHTCPPGVATGTVGTTNYRWNVSGLKPLPSEREQWLARGLEQALSWIGDEGHVNPQAVTIGSRLRLWLIRWLITEEQRGWLGAVLHGNYHQIKRYPDHPGPWE